MQPSATLNDIRLKVRRVTKSPNVNQITDAQIDQYVNTFYLFDFPEHLRLFDLRQNLTFTCAPNIDQYPLPTGENVSETGALGTVSGTNALVSIYPILGLPSDTTIVPGSVVVNVASTSGAQFTEVFPYNGALTGTGDGTDGSIDYNTGQLVLNFSSSIAASNVTIQFTYTLPEYVTIVPPLYIAGYQSFYTQSQEQFFRIYPKLRTIAAFAYGDGATAAYSGFAPAFPILRNEVLVNTQDVSGNPLVLNDDGLGNLVGDGTGTVNYLTGAISVTFDQNVNAGEAINAQTVPYNPSRPAAALFYNNIMTLRPVPDQSYTVTIEAYRRPTAMIASNSQPLLREWWQYLAMGAAMKIFEDRGDHQSIQLYMPIFDQYQRLAVRKTIVQYTSDRAATIYTEQSQGFGGNFFGQFNSQ